TSPAAPGCAVHGALVEWGGRRLDAIRIEAGPAGYTGRVRFEGRGVVGLRGGRLLSDGRLRVEPGRAAWVLRETEATGAAAQAAEDRSLGSILTLLRGTVEPRDVRVGWVPALPVRVEGWGPVPAATAAIRSP
ncbi:MAG: hypothetical protein O2894_11095, partial [Planctomycetota bacterium]|nr:hypothetical protein [Planctomycetota bacterium]